MIKGSAKYNIRLNTRITNLQRQVGVVFNIATQKGQQQTDLKEFIEPYGYAAPAGKFLRSHFQLIGTVFVDGMTACAHIQVGCRRVIVIGAILAKITY